MLNVLKLWSFEARLAGYSRRVHRQNASRYFKQALAAAHEGKLSCTHTEKLFGAIALATNYNRAGKYDLVEHALSGAASALGFSGKDLMFIVDRMPEESSLEWPSKSLRRPMPDISQRDFRRRVKTLGR